MWFRLLLLVVFSLNLLVPCYFSLINGEIATLILARGGSKGVRLKNLQTVGGISLLSRAIHTARDAGFQDITVSTDHPIIALQAIKDNAAVFHRSPITATDWAPSIWGVSEFLASRPDINILVLMQATSPFTRPTHVRSAIQQINDPYPYDCIFAATRSYKLRWTVINGKLKPVNFNVGVRMRRQDWGGEFLEIGAFYITRRWLLEQGQFQNDNCSVVEVNAIESLEVDTWEDLQIANVLHGANLV